MSKYMSLFEEGSNCYLNEKMKPFEEDVLKNLPFCSECECTRLFIRRLIVTCNRPTMCFKGAFHNYFGLGCQARISLHRRHPSGHLDLSGQSQDPPYQMVRVQDGLRATLIESHFQE